MEKWKTAIREAQTFSRMHVLLGMLDSCIKWDMSAENARCKVGRKKGGYPDFTLQSEALHGHRKSGAPYLIQEGSVSCEPTPVPLSIKTILNHSTTSFHK